MANLTIAVAQTKSPNELVAGEVRAHMARQQVTQTDLAAVKGRTQPYWSRRISGVVPFDIDDLTTIADFLGVQVMDLLAPLGSRTPIGR